jgi:hypothetical protein
VFVLGVYASAVHARWMGPDGEQRICAVAVASEPEIFWRGDSAEDIVRQVPVPARAGYLEPAGWGLNGPSGAALDTRFLHPLGLLREQAWLCDLVPHSCMNDSQRQAIEERYLPVMKAMGLPEPSWPRLPKCLANAQRQSEIQSELQESQASVLITLGDQPLRCFAAHFGSKDRLAACGETAAEYGRCHPIQIGGRQILLLPLVHPRQAAGLGLHSEKWADLHDQWTAEVAPQLL